MLANIKSGVSFYKVSKIFFNFFKLFFIKNQFFIAFFKKKIYKQKKFSFLEFKFEFPNLYKN